MAAKEQTVAEPHALSDALEHNNNKILDSFTVELAQSLTGDSQVERTLTRLLQISSFIDKNGGAYAIRYPSFRTYLQHKAEGGRRPVCQRRDVLSAP